MRVMRQCDGSGRRLFFYQHNAFVCFRAEGGAVRGRWDRVPLRTHKISLFGVIVSVCHNALDRGGYARVVQAAMHICFFLVRCQRSAFVYFRTCEQGCMHLVY